MRRAIALGAAMALMAIGCRDDAPEASGLPPIEITVEAFECIISGMDSLATGRRVFLVTDATGEADSIDAFPIALVGSQTWDNVVTRWRSVTNADSARALIDYVRREAILADRVIIQETDLPPIAITADQKALIYRLRPGDLAVFAVLETDDSVDYRLCGRIDVAAD